MLNIKNSKNDFETNFEFFKELYSLKRKEVSVMENLIELISNEPKDKFLEIANAIQIKFCFDELLKLTEEIEDFQEEFFKGGF